MGLEQVSDGNEVFHGDIYKDRMPQRPASDNQGSHIALLLETTASLLAAARISLADSGACRERRSTDRPKELGHGNRSPFIHSRDPGYGQNGPHEPARSSTGHRRTRQVRGH